MVAEKKFGLEKATQENLLALIEIRDNAAHLINKDLYISRRVQEIGTASLRNYLLLASGWFKLDLCQYNFFLMPISFFHGFEAAEPATRADYPVQIQKLLAYLDAREANDTDEAAGQHVALRLETKLVRGKDAAAIEFRYTDDPNAPAVMIREEDILKNYPMTFAKLIEEMQKRYMDCKFNDAFHRIKRAAEADKRYAYVRHVNPDNPKRQNKGFITRISSGNSISTTLAERSELCDG
jgi:hypothetical protein